VGLDGLRVRGSRLELADGGRAVHVVYRRTDEERIREDSGALSGLGELLLEPLRAGNVRLVNCFGTGVADDKLIYPYVEAMIGFYLGESPLLGSVRTYDLGCREPREEVLERLGELVVKPRDGHGGAGVLIGPHASRGELDRAVRAISAEPQRWLAQDVVELSTHPTVIEERLEPRHVDLRPFVFTDGGRIEAVPGGLTRVAFTRGSMVVNSSRQGGGKDTRVLR
jgi:carboxylate-amine ligase